MGTRETLSASIHLVHRREVQEDPGGHLQYIWQVHLPQRKILLPILHANFPALDSPRRVRYLAITSSAGFRLELAMHVHVQLVTGSTYPDNTYRFPVRSSS